MKHGVEQLIKECVRSRHIKQRVLCRGLCSAPAMCKYLGGDRHMDRLLLNMVLQRLGLSPDNFTTALGTAEYRYFEWRADVIRLMQIGRWHEVIERLGERDKINARCNAHIERQFELTARGLVASEYEHDNDKAIELFEQAILVTMPDFDTKCIAYSGLWSQDEMCIVLTLLQLKSRREDVTEQFESFIARIQESIIDIREKVKLFPLIAGIYGSILIGQNSYEKCAEICRTVIELMREHNTTFMLEQVLTLYIQSMTYLGRENETGKEKNWLKIWLEIQDFVGFKCNDVSLAYMTNFGQEIELINEIIKNGRRQAGIRHNDFSRMINCDYVSLTRIESGKHTPRKSNYKKATEELNLHDGYYYGEICTDNYQAYMLKYEIDLGIANEKFDELVTLVEKLEKFLDMNIVDNIQYIMDCRNIIDFKTNNITVEEFLKREKKILSYTTKCEDIQFKKVITSLEAKIIMHIATSYKQMGNVEKAIELLENALNYYEKSNVEIGYHYRNIMPIIRNLCVYYIAVNDLKKLEILCIKGIVEELTYRKGKLCAIFLHNYGSALAKKSDPIAGLHYLKPAIGWSDFFHNYATKEKAERNVEQVLKVIKKIS